MDEISINSTSLHHIDLTSDDIQLIEVDEKHEAANNYARKLINDIRNEDVRRNFSLNSLTTEINNTILNLLEGRIFNETAQIIANRLLLKEKESQRKYGHITDIKKGSLIQCYLKLNDSHTYVITKVDHNSIIDIKDLDEKTGPPFDKKVLKAALFQYNQELEVTNIHIYDSNTKISEYWWKDFLELKEINSDELNTRTSFNAVDNYLGRKIKPKSPSDRTFLRNNLISYYRTQSEFDYNIMIDTVVGSYEPRDIELDLDKIKEDLLQLPQKHKFDTKFTIKSKEISARFRTIIELLPHIDLLIKENIPELKNVIQPQLENNIKYIKIRSDTGYDYFK